MFWQFRKPAASDGVIDLYEIRDTLAEEAMGFGPEWTFVIAPHGRKREAGQINVRLGESECVYYFGHIGYHIDPPYRGRRWAARACMLVLPLIRRHGRASVVITTDPDNMASRRTCERLGCVLESTVPVPQRLQKRWMLSPAKRRYVWRTGGGQPDPAQW